VQKAPDTLTILGGWLFRHRTALPLPIAAAILTLRLGQAPPSTLLSLVGIALTLAGEALRLWGVRHIGVISRTRSERLGPLVDTGPFGLIRNPLYVGNVLLWVGFAITARLLWLAPVVVALLGLEYHAIVRWEEQLLEARVGDAYRAYVARVPRWLPLGGRSAGRNPETMQPWRATLFSERGTLVAIAIGYLLIWIKLKT
jgi:protein-S-isoprenylcysteine O-methyltransferase Ste14